MKTHTFPRWLLIFCLLAVIAVPRLSGVPTLEEIVPPRAAPGTQVELRGSGFDLMQPHSVTIGGMAATVNLVTSNKVVFTVAPGMQGGKVALTEGGSTYTHPLDFQVLRIVTGTFVPPPGLKRDSYDIFADENPVPLGPAGQFQVAVPVGEPALIWAVRGEFDPAFLAVVAPSNAVATIDATSTAIAWGYISPFIFSRDTQRALNALAALTVLPETTALANAIAGATTAGLDYANTASFEDALAAQIAAYVGGTVSSFAGGKQPKGAPAGIQSGFQSGYPSGTLVYVLNPHASQVGSTQIPPARLEMKISEPDDVPGFYEIEFKTGPDGNRLDWFVELFQLDPTAFPNGTNSIAGLSALGPSERPKKLSLGAVGTTEAGASLATKKIDLLGLISDALRDAEFSAAGAESPRKGILVPKEPAGVYISQAYSGNLMFGTGLLLTPQNGGQSELISMLAADPQWTVALGVNASISVVDMVSAFLPITNVTAKLSYNISKDIFKAVSPRVLPGGKSAITRDTLYEAIKAAAKTTIKSTLSEGLKSFGKSNKGEGFLRKAASVVQKTFDIFGKVSNALQSLERASALVDFHALALERTIVVIGEPFAPRIESFHPQTARSGEILVIEGANFPAGPELEVSFCTFLQTTNPNLPSATLPLTILSRTATSLAVRVPTNFTQVFPNNRAYVCLKNTTSGAMTTSLRLQEPYREFVFIPPPSLFAVEPNPVRPGGILTLRGTNFFDRAGENHIIVFDGVTEVTADYASDDAIMVRVPPTSEGPHTVAVKLFDQTTPAQPFVVQIPNSVAAGFAAGLSITVTRWDFSNAADGQISLLEAFLIANGTLGRPIEQHLACESLPPEDPDKCPFVPRETDWVSGDDESGGGGGPGSADFIQLHTDLFGKTNTLPGALPAISSGDTFNLNCVILGGGVAAPAWLLDGVKGVILRNATFRNFSGHGIHYRNGASNNLVENVNIEDCGGTGVFLDMNASDNEFYSLFVDGATGGDAVKLTGAGVRNNLFYLPRIGSTNALGKMSRSSGWGLRIDNGASFNQVAPGTVRSNASGGVLISGNMTRHNLIGYAEGSLPRLFDIYNNNGPGVKIDDAPNNVLRYLNPAGNQGDGVLLTGANCARNQVDSIYSGVDYFVGGFAVAKLANQGSGIHLNNGAHDNLIGSRIPGAAGGRGFLAGDLDHGILIEGSSTSNNVVNRKHVGVSLFILGPTTYLAPGGHGIYLRDGAHHNIIGDTHQFLDIHVVGITNGSGVMIEGAGTDFNQVIGAQIGCNHGSPIPVQGFNRVGVQVRNGAKGNVVGLPGQPFQVVNGFNVDDFRFGNSIGNCTEAGVKLDQAGGEADSANGIRFANLIRNNLIGEQDPMQFGSPAPNGVGVLLVNHAAANIVGGASPDLGNRIVNNHVAGVMLSNVMPPTLVPLNRIHNNLITNSGALKAPPQETAQNPAQHGVGILVVDSIGNRIGESLNTANRIERNLFGIYLHTATSNRIHGNVLTNNTRAGILVRGGETNLIGGVQRGLGNQIISNGSNNPNDAGVRLLVTMNNRVSMNEIGTDGGNRGAGVLIEDSPGNLIGGAVEQLANLIVSNVSDGVRITGALSQGNRIQRNRIGTDAADAALPNGRDGVRLENGAALNWIGGSNIVTVSNVPIGLPAPNVIAHNLGAGVLVSGNSTVGNSILNNSIYGNAGLGIDNVAGGNHELPSPLLGHLEPGLARGVVTNLLFTPENTRVQVFSDAGVTDFEGEQLLGEGLVDSNGVWEANLTAAPFFRRITMTATHPTSGSTSEFGTGTTNFASGGFRVERTDGRSTDQAQAGAVRMPVLRLTAKAAVIPPTPLPGGAMPVVAISAGSTAMKVLVTNLVFQTSGSLNDLTHVLGAELYLDADGNGVVSPADLRIAGPVTASADNGTLTFGNLRIEVGDGEAQRWLLVYDLAPGAPNGATFAASLASAADVPAKLAFASGVPITTLGAFPLQSPTFTVQGGGPQSLSAWKASVFTAPQLADESVSGDFADFDGDGLITFLEYAFNLNPLVPDANTDVETGAGKPKLKILTLLDPDEGELRNYVGLTYVRRKAPSDVSYRAEHSFNLFSWAGEGEAPSLFDVVSQTDVGAGDQFELFTIRSTLPITGPLAELIQYLQLQVQRTE